MKNILKYSFIWLSAFMLTGLNGCKEDIVLENIDSDRYQLDDGNYGSIVDQEGKRSFSIVEFSKVKINRFYLSLSETAAADVAGTFEVDVELLNQYNTENSSSYELLPAEAYELAGGITLKAGEKKSSAAILEVKTIDALDANKTYALPLKVRVSSGNVNVNTNKNSFILFVKDLTKLPDTEKANGIKVISCTRINPLNHLAFTLKKSNKLLIDMFILFSTDIKFNPETGRLYLYSDSDVTEYLQNSKKYFKPLQDRGMKVVISILGGHEACGISNLSEETAKEFALELKHFCDAYGLDGIFFDDEYSKYVTPPPPGFVRPSTEAVSRLIYETKKIMPDKLMTVYGWSTTRYLVEVDGHQPGDYIDWAIVDYGVGPWGLDKKYKGLPKTGMSIYSQEFAQNRYASEGSLQQIVDGGYGGNMIFSLNPFTGNWDEQKNALKRIAKVLYKDELDIWDDSKFLKPAKK
ncbi:MAG: DUF1735 domain-containing protein [Cytophagales bacterium]|nr:DUF1735 domain-containing protein [Cytophagales bacterium]